MQFDMLYTGHLYDWTAGMHLAPFRQYNPDIGSWLSREPLGLDGPNLYHYAFNDPVNLWDPTGLQAQLGSGSGLSQDAYLERMSGGSSYIDGAAAEALGIYGEAGLNTAGEMSQDMALSAVGGAGAVACKAGKLSAIGKFRNVLGGLQRNKSQSQSMLKPLTRGSSLSNVGTNVTVAEAAENLVANGFKVEFKLKAGTRYIGPRGERYFLRLKSKDGSPTLDYYPPGARAPKRKIRLNQ